MDHVCERKGFLRISAQSAECHGAIHGLFLAHDQQSWDLGQRVLADLVIDFLVPEVDFGAEPAFFSSASTSAA